MNSYASDPDRLLRVRAALERGGAEDLDAETMFVVEQFEQATEKRLLEEVLHELSLGISPYHVFDRYPLRGQQFIRVPRNVMPPGFTTLTVRQTLKMLVDNQPPSLIIDLGCGTGVLGIEALIGAPDARGILIDLDLAAVDATRANLLRLGLANRAEVRNANGLEGIDSGSVDLLVANLPFVPSSDVQALPARFRNYAPRMAVDGGVDGVALFRALLPAIERTMASSGVCVLQVGDGQRQIVENLLGTRWSVFASFSHPNVLVAGPA